MPGIFTAFRKVKLDNSAFAQQEDATSCTVLSFNQEGGITTFSPQMIAGTVDCPNRFIVANIRDLASLDDLDCSPIHQQLKTEIEAGIRKCRAECGYFNLCGGGAPASKFYEHGTFDCTETRECRFSKQLLADVLLEKATAFASYRADATRQRLQGCRQVPPLRMHFHRSHSRCIDGKMYVWDVEKLWKLAECLPVQRFNIDSILETNRDCWFCEIREPTIRNVAQHAKRINEADLSFPIILNADGALMDGGHRIAKAIMQGTDEILAVRFDRMPTPDAIEDLGADL